MNSKKLYKICCHFCGDARNLHCRAGADGIFRRNRFGRGGVFICEVCHQHYAAFTAGDWTDPLDIRVVLCHACSGKGGGEFEFSPSMFNFIACGRCFGRGWSFVRKSPLERLADCVTDD